MIENKIFSYCNIHRGIDVQARFRLEKLKEMYLLEYFRLYGGGGNVALDPKEVGWHGMEGINLSQDR